MYMFDPFFVNYASLVIVYMNYTYLMIFIVFIIAVFLIYVVFRKVGNKVIVKDNELSSLFIQDILRMKVPLYMALDEEKRDLFTQRVAYFLRTTRISAEKGAVITDEDKVLVAASATIPLINFENWAFENLDEVILYPDYFDERFDTNNEDRNVAGMVGTGALRRKMILSLPALRRGFNRGGESNTAIHEFVHLIDMADGEVDGVPEYIIPKELIEPWLKEMDLTIREIQNGQSDINEYAATNDAEFLAVTTEYFFKKPKDLQQDHPKLYALLDEIYNRKN